MKPCRICLRPLGAAVRRGRREESCRPDRRLLAMISLSATDMICLILLCDPDDKMDVVRVREVGARDRVD